MTVAQGAQIAANATVKGNGGRVTVLSTGTTVMDGTIAAMGGPQGGNGGFVETSGLYLGVSASAIVNTAAQSTSGQPGTWLLDPYDIDITGSDNNNNLNNGTFTATDDPATVANTSIQNALATGNVVVTTTGAGTDKGNITVSATIDWSSSKTLSLLADDNITINDAITGTNGGLVLSAGNTTNTGTITIGAPISVNNLAGTAGSSGAIYLASTGSVVTTTGGGQSYNSPVVLQADATLTDTGNGTIQFASTVDDASAGTHNLVVDAGTGIVTFGSAVGGSAALASLTVTGPTTLDSNVTTTGTQTFNNAVTLGAAATLATTNSAVDFASTVDGGFALNVNAGTGVVTFGSTVGGSAALTGLTVTGPTTIDANVTTSGTQTFNSGVTLGADSTLSTTNSAVDFASTVDGGFALGVNRRHRRRDIQRRRGWIGSARRPDGDRPDHDRRQHHHVRHADLQQRGDARCRRHVEHDEQRGGFRQHGGCGGFALGVNAGTGVVTFSSAVGGSAALAGLTVTGPTTIDANVTTSGTQSFNSAVTLGADATLSTTNSAVDFASTVDGGFALDVNTGTGVVTFGSTVGGSAALTGLTVTGPTTIDANVTTSGTQTFNSAVTLGASATLATTDSPINFAGSITGGANSLTLSSGTGSETLSGITTSGTLTLNTGGVVTLDGGTYALGNAYTFAAVTTNGSLVFGMPMSFGAVTQASATTFDSSASSAPLGLHGHGWRLLRPGGRHRERRSNVRRGGHAGQPDGHRPGDDRRQHHHDRHADLQQRGDAGCRRDADLEQQRSGFRQHR